MPVETGSAQLQPAGPQPLDKPHPALAAIGFHGPVSEFNQRLAQIDTAYRAAHDQPPPPGIVLDVARSQVKTTDVPKLFNAAYGNSRLAQLSGAVAQHRAANPDEQFVTRNDGYTQPDNPGRRVIQPQTEPSYQALQKQHPWVQDGALPIPGEAEFFKAINYLNKPIQAPDQRLAQVDPLSQLAGPTTQDVQEARRGVQTIRQAQTELNKEMGTHLPVTGVVNQDWVDTLHNWMKSKDYFQKQTAYQAQQSGFGSNVAAYKKAFLAKQNATRHGLYGWFLQSMPLPLFGHGGFWQDLTSLPGYIKGTSNNPLDIGLHSLTRSAGLGLDVIGGTVSQAKADLAAGTTLAAYMANLPGSAKTYDDALAKARAQLHANPTWMRALGGGYVPLKEGRTLRAVDQATNLVGDLILLRKPAFTGEAVAPGATADAAKSEYLNAASRWAFKDLKAYGQDGIGRAAARLEGGQGARALVSRSAKLVQNGTMTEEEFANHVARMFARGHTVLTVAGKDIQVEGPLLKTLRTDKLPAPGKSGQAWLQAKNGLRDFIDKYQRGASKTPGMNQANAFIERLRAGLANAAPLAAHAAPTGSRLGYFDSILPERVFNFVNKYELGDRALANKLESDLVRFQGRENIRGIQTVERKLNAIWHEKYPSKTPPGDEPFHALLSTETPSVFRFPGGEADPKLDENLGRLGVQARKFNAVLNNVAKLHARIILSGLPIPGGGLSLFWKHSIGDGLRAFVGGVASKFTPEVRSALAEIDRVTEADPALSRQLGVYMEKMRMGEVRWALKKGGRNTFAEDFNTGDKLAHSNFMEAAGGYLRRHLEAPELQGYRDGSLVDVILRDKAARAAWKSMKSRNPDYTAETHAGNISKEYQDIQDALEAKGLSWDDALTLLRASRGHIDQALGKWIRDNKIDFPVRKGMVEHPGVFDELTSRWIGNVVMRPNKMWRTSIGRAALGEHYAAFRAAGWDEASSLKASMDTAEAIVKYHMLDFANRLQVEQDLRWLSYFATKHRLYWKWVLSTFARNPRYAAAVYDFRKELNNQQGITLPFKAFGEQWQIPLARLVWVPGREYDETSPVALAVLNFIKSGGSLDAAVQGAAGTGGNIVTRSDTAIFLGVKLMKIESGSQAATYHYAYAGLDKTTADRVKRALNEYQSEYFKDHGHYAPEAAAVKLVLLHQMGMEYWRANLPLPVVPYQQTTEQDQQLTQYESLLDPRQRREFIDKHPGFSDNFGIYQDPKTYLHNQPFFQAWAKAVDAYRSARAHLYAEAKKGGVWTTQLEQQRRELSAALVKTRNKLLIEDAQQSGIDTHGLVPDGNTVPYGPWGKVVNKDPQFDPQHALSVWFPKLQKGQQDNVFGPMVKQAQQDLAKLNDPNSDLSQSMTSEEAKTLRRELLQKIEVFNSYPTDALGALRDKYQTQYVNKYWATYDAKYAAIGNLPSGERAQADAQFRAWRDSQDHPVKINGVMFPSPLRMAWATLDPKTRESRLAYLASKPPQDLADYELDLLDIPHPPHMSQVWAALDQAEAKYRQTYPGHSISKAQVAQAVKQLSRQPGWEKVYTFYVNTVDQPRIRQFEQTDLYRGMPSTVRAQFDQAIGSAAIKVAADIKAGGHSSYYGQEWRNAIKNQIQPWLDEPEQAALKAYLEPFGPNFLNTLVSR